MPSPPSNIARQRRSLLPVAIGLSLLIHGALLSVLSNAPGSPPARPGGDAAVRVNLIRRDQSAAVPVAAATRHAAAPQRFQPLTMPVPPTLSSEPPGASPAAEARATLTLPATLSSKAATEVALAAGGTAPADVATSMPAGSRGAPGDGTGAPGPEAFTPPSPLRAERPPYPPAARLRGWEGDVLLRVRVDAAGVVSTVGVERSSGYAILDQAASRAVRSWLFRPARHGRRPVTVEVRVPVQFRLAEL